VGAAASEAPAVTGPPGHDNGWYLIAAPRGESRSGFAGVRAK
jgi:hypothetical protein